MIGLCSYGDDLSVSNLTMSGRVSIGRTNIFQSMDIGITRVMDRGEKSKAWINIAQVDSWPNWTKAGEWWANTGINDCVTEISWLNNSNKSSQVLQHVGEETLYIELLKNKTSLVRISPLEEATFSLRREDGTILFEFDKEGNLFLRGNIKTNWNKSRLDLIYHENFENGIKPDNWENWNQESSISWNYTNSPLKDNVSAAFSDKDLYSMGAFYRFNLNEDKIMLNFKFRCLSFPPSTMEICDLYYSDGIGRGEEICDIYLYPNGQLLLSMLNSPIRTTSPIPVNQTVNVWIRYERGVNTYGSVAWSLDETEPTSGANFNFMTSKSSNFPINSFLFGPVYNDIVFMYDEVKLYRIR